MQAAVLDESAQRKLEVFEVVVKQLLQQLRPEDQLTLVSALAEVDAPLVAKNQSMPFVQMLDRKIFCGGAHMDVARKPLTKRLFQVFLERADLRVTLEELMLELYGVDAKKHHSPRYLNAVKSNVVKIISRTRTQISADFSESFASAADWFVFNPDEKTWILYQIKNAS